MPNRLLFDTESDGFVKDATKVHCVAAVDVDTRERFDWKPHEIDAAVEVLDKADIIIGHNIQRHDVPLLTKVKGWSPRAGVVMRDTMICARLKHPNVRDTDGELVAKGRMPQLSHDGKRMAGRHTLEAWGFRLGEHKIAYDGGFEVWTPEMHTYMLQDVGTNLRLWDHLRIDEYSQAAVELEHRIAVLCDDIEREGVPFDVQAAGELHAELVQRKHVVEEKLKAQFGTWLAPISPDAKRCEFTPKKTDVRRGYVAGAAFSKLKRVVFNPGSRDHIIKVLTDRGWKPTEFTENGKPKVDENVVGGLVNQFPEVDGLADYLMVDKRLSQLADGDQALLKHVGQDGKIHGVINPMGTITSRASHFNPNLGQVPSAKKPYGKDFRAKFKVPFGWKLVGADMEGLELRGLAHFLALNDGGKYANAVLSGDPHWMNAQAMGLAHGERDKHNQLHTVIREDGSKRFIYAYVYGCGDSKAGEIIYKCLLNAMRTCGDEGKALFHDIFGRGAVTPQKLRKVGKKAREDFQNKIDGFAALKDRIGKQVDKFGWVPGIDGRRIPVRSEHSALNFMIQSAGALLCKRWGVDAADDLASKFKLGWSGAVVPVLWVHDEYQVACREGLEEEVGEILVKHARKAGEPYNFRVPLDSKYTVGSTWADTH